MQRKKPTVKQLGNFVLSVYDKMRQIERIAMGNSQAFLQYLEMTGELDKFNDYLKEKVDQNDAEKTKEHKKGKKKQTKRGGTTKTSTKPRKNIRSNGSQ